MAIKILAIVQARNASTRLPGKVIKKVNGITLIEILFRRLSRSRLVDKIILATSESKDNDSLCEIINQMGFEVFRGSEKDVLKRYFMAAQKHNPNTVVRVTGDCPIIDPQLVDKIIEYFLKNNVDYVSNGNPPTFPDGLDTEVFTFAALRTAHQKATSLYDREHVTPFINNSSLFKKANFQNTDDFSDERWTVDQAEDLKVVRNIIENFSPDLNFTWNDVIELKKSHPEYFEHNKKIKRNEGAKMATGQKLWKRAQRVIPGGNMLLSKRPEMFLPEKWPAYYSKAKGCTVWDLDGNKYFDMSIMGIGTNILGYGNSEVDQSIQKVVKNGNMSTLNCPEEVYLAEKLLELHPWSQMVRFARTGGEANAIAVRIARAASGREKIAICGYHGWHDWYLAANLGDNQNLDQHLLPGLAPEGVPTSLKGSALTFNYNKIDELIALIEKHDIGLIKMEVSRSTRPKDNFLKKVRKISKDNNIILIFDECTSGFRETFGGLHKKYNVEPDLAVFGKALGNGYAISAIIGKREIMESAQNTFISSTFWTERIGPTAALKTLEIMEREKSWEVITKKGELIRDNWEKLALNHNLPIEISGLPALINFKITSQNWLKYKTYLTQEMLKKGFLASNLIIICTDHKNEIIDQYIENLNNIFATIAECESGRSIDDLLEVPICHEGFKRLN